MEDIDSEFVNKVQEGDIIVANKNFGCGSSREHAPIAIKASGISCVIAETFARIFYRNAINIGLPIIECKEAAEGIEAGDMVEIDFDSGVTVSYTHLDVYKRQNVGDAGLAAINIAYPITAIVQAVGTGIGMGGAIHIAVNIGAGDKEKVKKYLGNTLSLTLICLLYTSRCV